MDRPGRATSNVHHVEVQAQDAFGNLTTGFSNDFTIYPSTSDVPGALGHWLWPHRRRIPSIRPPGCHSICPNPAG